MRARRVLTFALAGVVITTGMTACGGDDSSGGKGGKAATVLNVGMPQGPQTENHNPFLTTAAGAKLGYEFQIYEPLLMWNPVKPAEPSKPWLAVGADWAKDYKSVTVNLRDDVTWSDGQKFTAEDVAFTYQLMKDFPALNINAFPFDEITATGNQVKITFKEPQFVNQVKLLALTQIVPKHIWSKIKDPTTDPNKNPIGTGAYTLKSFTPQTTTLVARPSGYWQNTPLVKELRYTSYNDNNAQTTALATGANEWGFVFIPNVKQVFVSKDPKNNKIWAPPALGIHGLWINTTKKPFDDKNLRKAMSMVIDRKDIFETAEAGYFHPEVTSVTGLPTTGEAYIAPEFKGKNQTVDVEGAKTLLTGAGYKLEGTTLKDPSGKPVTITLTDPAGWSDYQTSLEIVKDDLSKIGIAAKIDKANEATWFKNMEGGQFEAGFRWTNGGPTPYDIYQTIMDGDLLQPIGKASPQGNYGRFKSPQASDALKAYANASDEDSRAEALATIQRVFVDEMPMIPVGADNIGAAYSTRNWTGWPSDADPYSGLQPTQPYAAEVVLKLKPATS